MGRGEGPLQPPLLSPPSLPRRRGEVTDAPRLSVGKIRDGGALPFSVSLLPTPAVSPEGRRGTFLIKAVKCAFPGPEGQAPAACLCTSASC